MEPLLTISDVSRRSGVASSALRFYEERGLITSERAGSGHRRFPRAVLRRVAFIVFAQRIGLTLEEIARELGKLPTDRVPTRGDWARLSGEWRKRIDQRIAELQRLRAGLTECIGCGCFPSTGAVLPILPIELGAREPVRAIGLADPPTRTPAALAARG